MPARGRLALTAWPVIVGWDIWAGHKPFVSAAAIFATFITGSMSLVAMAEYLPGVTLGPTRLARFSVRSLTHLAVLLAGGGRRELRDEWQAHLGGENGHDPVTRAKVSQALGLVASAARFRFGDAADLVWRPADAVLGSRILSNLFVWVRSS